MKRNKQKEPKLRQKRIAPLFAEIRRWIADKIPKRSREPITAREIFILPGEWAFVKPDAREKRELKHRIYILILLLLLLFATLVGLNTIYRQSSTVFPDAIALRSDYGMQFYFDEKPQDQACRVSISQGTVTTGISMQYNAVNVYYTDENLPDFISLDMIAGSYFKIMEYTQQNKNIVISEEIAVAQFKTHHAVGNKLLLNGEEYTVCGVYRPKESALTDISSNGYADVYLPYMAVEEIRSLPVQIIYVDTEITGYTNAVVGALTNKTTVNIWPQHITSYPDLLELMVFFKRLFWFMIGAAFIVVCTVWMWHYTVLAYQKFTGERSREVYPYLVRAVFWLMLGVGLYLLIRFELMIPQSVLPNDNIFDFAYYRNEILSALQSRNLMTLYDFHWNYCFYALAGYSILLMLSVVLFGIWFAKLCGLVRYIREMNAE